MTKTNIINEKDFIFDLIPNSGFCEYYNNRAEVKFEDYNYEIDLSGNVYFKTKHDLYRLDDYGITFRKNELQGLIDNFGKIIIEPKYGHISMPLREGKNYNLAVANGGDSEGMELVRNQLTAALPHYRHLWDGEIDGTLSVYIGDGILGAAVQILDENNKTG